MACPSQPELRAAPRIPNLRDHGEKNCGRDGPTAYEKPRQMLQVEQMETGSSSSHLGMSTRGGGSPIAAAEVPEGAAQQGGGWRRKLQQHQALREAKLAEAESTPHEAASKSEKEDVDQEEEEKEEEARGDSDLLEKMLDLKQQVAASFVELGARAASQANSTNQLVYALQRQEKTYQARISHLEDQLQAAEHQRLQAFRDTGLLAASVLLPQISHMAYGLHDISRHTPAGQYLCRLFTTSTVRHRVDRDSGYFAPRPRLRVVRIQLVVNPKLYEEYMTGLRRLQQCHGGACEPFTMCPQLRVHPNSMPPGWGDLNEHFLLHGAPSNVIKEICEDGFDPQRGGETTGCRFGIATYFAINASKCDIYTDPPAARRPPRDAERKIILARVPLGRVKRVQTPCVDRARAPDDYDCVWGDSREHGGCVDHPEIMIYRRQQAYPQFVVTYVHECPIGALCAECRKRPPAP